MDPRIDDVDLLLAEIERLRNGSRLDNKNAYKLAEENRGIDPKLEAIYLTFLLFSAEKGADAVRFLQSHEDDPCVDARMGWFFTQTGNVDQGIKLLQKAAYTGHQFARHSLAIMAYKGQGMAKDVPHAVEMLETLADEKFIPSMCSLGAHYYDPFSFANKQKTGLELINQAAAAGNQNAISILQFIEDDALRCHIVPISIPN